MNLAPWLRVYLDLLSVREIEDISDSTWKEVLAFADRTQCTLYIRTGSATPGWISEAISRRRTANRRRRERLRETYAEIAHAFTRSGIDFVLLKSFTHECGFGIVGDDRVQYDLDLFYPTQIQAAHRVLGELRYKPHGTRDLSEVHSQPMVRPSTWTWRGDHYDPEMPIAVELHTHLWSGTLDRIPLPELEEYWPRRTRLRVAGMDVPALAEPDRIAFAALHVFRHVLHHNTRVSHVLELARILQTRAADTGCWTEWERSQTPRALRLQALAFRFAHCWFGGPVPMPILDQWNAAPPCVNAWFADYGFAPLLNLIEPNKHILWLHKELVDSGWDRRTILWKGLFPAKFPQPDLAAKRAAYHLRALFATVLARTSSRASTTSD